MCEKMQYHYTLKHFFFVDLASVIIKHGNWKNFKTIFFFFSLSTFYKFRVLNQGDDIIRQNNPMSTINATVQIPQIMMKKLHIPFTFRLESDATSSNQNAVKFVVSSNVRYSIQAFFNVEIRALHMQLWRSWGEIRASIFSQNEFIIDQSHFKEVAIDLRWENNFFISI